MSPKITVAILMVNPVQIKLSRFNSLKNNMKKPDPIGPGFF